MIGIASLSQPLKISSAAPDKAKKSFNKVIKYKPLSSRSESKEIYILCKGVLKIWYIMQQCLWLNYEKIFYYN